MMSMTAATPGGLYQVDIRGENTWDVKSRTLELPEDDDHQIQERRTLELLGEFDHRTQESTTLELPQDDEHRTQGEARNDAEMYDKEFALR